MATSTNGGSLGTAGNLARGRRDCAGDEAIQRHEMAQQDPILRSELG